MTPVRPSILLLSTLLGATLMTQGCGGKASGKARIGPTAIAGGTTLSVDKSRCDASGKKVVESDTNGDGKPDIWKLTTVADTPVLTCRQVDLNYDSKLDIVRHFEPSGLIVYEELDLDFDGKFDLAAHYQGGVKIREEMDTNFDKRPDLVKFYESNELARVERDANSDGRVDQWEYYESGKLDRIGYDTKGTGQVDKWDRAPEDASAGGAASPVAPAAAPAAPPAAQPATPPAR